WIRSKPVTAESHGASEMLRAWREPAESLRERNLALAYIGSSLNSKLLKRYREGVRLLNRVLVSNSVDGPVAMVTGMQFMRQNQPAKAAPWFRRALEEEPRNSLRHLSLAAALAGAGDTAGARQHAEEAIRLEPLLEEAYAFTGQSAEPQASRLHREGHYREA